MDILDEVLGRSKKYEEALNRASQNNKQAEIIAKKPGVVKKIKVDIDELKDCKKFFAFDTETTGLSPKSDRIVELGAVIFENGEVIEEYGTLVNPKIPIPPQVSAINHITNEMLKGAESEEIVYEDFTERFKEVLNGEVIICAHNAPFDMNFLATTLERLGYDANLRYADTLTLSRNNLREVDNYKLDTVAAYFGFVNDNSHRALSDAKICGQIFNELLKLNNVSRVNNERFLSIAREIIKQNEEEKNYEMRRKDREITDLNMIYDILCRCDTINLGMNGGIAPYVIPMTFACSMEDGQITVYFHSAKGGRKWDILNKDPNVCVEAHLYYKTVEEKGGITAKYESVIGTGVAQKLESNEEKIAAFKHMTEHYKHSGFPAESCKGLPDCDVFKVVLKQVSGKHNL